MKINWAELKRIRKEKQSLDLKKDFSMKEIAKKLDLWKQTYINYETGFRNISHARLRKLFYILELTDREIELITNI
jgi:transcriptional regulator with XRE-family HTH domain